MSKQQRISAVVLTVAGSDSGGGAGVQADLKTFQSFGVFGTAAITCLTAQNPRRVSRIVAITPSMVSEQMERVLEVFPVRAAKTGMLFNAGIIEAVAATFQQHRFRKLVVDPVMISTSGTRLLKPNAVAALTTRLFPSAMVVTPNRAEAEILSGRRIGCLAEQRDAAQALADRFGTAVVIKGGHCAGEKRVVDLLFDGREFHEFVSARIPKVKTHGTGCLFSAAIAAHLVLRFSLVESVAHAKRFVTNAIRNSVRVGRFTVLKL